MWAIKMNKSRYLDIISHNDELYEEYKEEKLSNFDSEKGSVEVTCHLKRLSDGKKFTTKFTRFSQGNIHSEDYTLHEVVPKPKAYKITGEDIGSLLDHILSFHDEVGEDIFYKSDLLPILKELGLPEPVWGNTMSLEQFKAKKQS